MKTSRFSDPQILRQATGDRRQACGRALPQAWHDAAARQAFAQQTLRGSAFCYKWRAKYGGMVASMISQMQPLKDNNWHLKKIFADINMQAEILTERSASSKIRHQCTDRHSLITPQGVICKSQPVAYQHI
jgi:putative transposase